ncbi:hypothetical protein MTF65_12980 [Streptomyces sp. APSN-46.1]|nr:hypothetical protein [Streptomyces sp. APSN-46.1]
MALGPAVDAGGQSGQERAGQPGTDQLGTVLRQLTGVGGRVLPDLGVIAVGVRPDRADDPGARQLVEAVPADPRELGGLCRVHHARELGEFTGARTPPGHLARSDAQLISAPARTDQALFDPQSELVPPQREFSACRFKREVFRFRTGHDAPPP